jgi:CheY-like chemotaxis protein
MRPRILLIGGNPSVAAMVTEHLHDGGYEVESVAFCDHALAMLSRARFDLVLILSLHVPWTMWPSSFSPEWRADIMNAILLLKHIRTLPSPPPVILMSGSPLAVVEEEALASGAFAFLRKPVALDELARFVVLALQSRKGQPTI